MGGIRVLSWSWKESWNRREAKVFRAHAAKDGVCDHLINAIKRIRIKMLTVLCGFWWKVSKKKPLEDDGGAEKFHHDGQS